MEGAGVPVEFSKGEWGAGQEEINLRYAEALEMADRHVLYKHGVKEIASAQGASVTFMAKYDSDSAGSSFHLHSSLWDKAGKKNLFHEKGQHHGSAIFGHWLAGQMAMAREFSYFYAPYVNSYKRYQAGSLRAHADRGRRRQPHLRLPAVRGGLGLPGGEPHPGGRRQPLPGLRGHHRRWAPRDREEAAEPPTIYHGNAYEDPACPRCPRPSGRPSPSWKGRSVARDGLRGRGAWSTTSHTARLEQEAFDQAVTCWELMRRFERL